MNMDNFYIILTYGISFGILLMVIIYSLTRYFYTKELLYISYSLMQFFSLCYLITYSQFFKIEYFLLDMFLLLASLFALAFGFSFFKGKFLNEIKTSKELFIYTILFSFIILTSIYHYFLFEYLPYTIIYFLLFVSILLNLKGEIQASIIYVSGWSIFCLVLFFMDIKYFYLSAGYIDIVLIAFAIEALLFTVSVSYSYRIMKDETKDYENMLLKQSRLANSGEMIANITHQFRQPLNSISYILINLKKRFENNKLDESYMEKKVSQANEQLQYLSKTVDDFTNFYAPSKIKEKFLIKDAISNAIVIIQAELKQKNIVCSVKFNVSDELRVYGFSNELSQAILSILSNSKDVLKNIENPYINISINSTSADIIITIEDNGGGIKEKNISKIFDAYITNKQTGTGLGLYLSKKIIENSFNGNISVSNTDKGALFKLLLEKAI